MDAFRLRRTVVADYAQYIQSFLTILDPRIAQFVDKQLSAEVLWPDPLLQLSPSYQAAEAVEALVLRDILHPLCGALFRMRGVRVLVRDTRIILLIRTPMPAEEAQLASLQFALQRGIEAVFQVEPQELATERIGIDAQR